MHSGHRLDPALRGRRDERPAGIPVAAGTEGRARDQHVAPAFLQITEQLPERLLLMLGEVVVSAGDRGDDVHVAELGREPPARASGSVEPSRRSLGLVLAAQAGEELVQVVNSPHSERAPSASWPIWFAAPR